VAPNVCVCGRNVVLQLRAIEECFPMVLFTMLYEVMLTFESIGAKFSWPVQMRGIEQNFPMALFIMLYKVILTFVSVGEIVMSLHTWKLLSDALLLHSVVCQIFLQLFKGVKLWQSFSVLNEGLFSQVQLHWRSVPHFLVTVVEGKLAHTSE